MNKIFKLTSLLTLIFLLSSPLVAKGKHLILAEGNDWLPLLPKNLIEHHQAIEKLPFSGFVMVGNSYTNRVMKKDEKLLYEYVWYEVKGMKNLYKEKQHNFMQINLDFPADFWNDEAWEQTSKNFSVVAKVAKELGFKGIVFDDEPYSQSALRMSNFRFPSKQEVASNPQSFEDWEKKGSELNWVDKLSYRNPNHTFQEHMQKVTERFKAIMQVMCSAYPNLTVMVYNGPSYAHENSNRLNTTVTDVGLPREHEYKGPIFLGLKEGLENNATLHDMGESYRYRKDRHFKNSYRWRKYDIANDGYNDFLDSTYQWLVPKAERASWQKDVQVGFMVFNKPQSSNYEEFDTTETSTLADIKQTLQKALKYSDNYVIYYAQEQDWLLPNQQYPLKERWMEMMKEVYEEAEQFSFNY